MAQEKAVTITENTEAGKATDPQGNDIAGSPLMKAYEKMISATTDDIKPESKQPTKESDGSAENKPDNSNVDGTDGSSKDVNIGNSKASEGISNLADSLKDISGLTKTGDKDGKRDGESGSNDKHDSEQSKEQEGDSKDDAPEKEIKPEEFTKEHTRKSIQRLLKRIGNISEELKAERAKTKDNPEHVSKITDLEKKLAEESPKAEELKKQIETLSAELLQYRRQYEIDNDPSIKERFDKRVENANNDIYALLKSEQMSDENIAMLKEMGGYVKFIEKSPDAAEQVYNALPFNKRTQLQLLIADMEVAEREKKSFIEGEKAKAKDFFAGKEKQKVEREQLGVKTFEGIAKSVDDWYESTTKSADLKPILGDIQVNEGATDAEKAEAKEENDFRAALRGFLKDAISIPKVNNIEDLKKTTQKGLDIALAATTAWHYKRNSDKQAKRIEELEAEIKRYRDTGTTLKKQSVIGGGQKHDAKLKQQPRMSTQDSLMAAWERIEGKSKDDLD